MIRSGVHLGHQVRKWNPKMKTFIYIEKDGHHIIDLILTQLYLDKVTKFLFKAGKKKKTVLFVGTKRHFGSIIKNCAQKANAHYVNRRWLGGMLTNWSTMKICLKNLQELSKQEKDGMFERLTKKEAAVLGKKKERLEKYFGGLKNMKKRPDIVIIVGQLRELNAAKECQKLGIRTITILDTNCDPTLTDFVIPGNDDSVGSVALLLNELTESLVMGQNS